MKMDPLVSLSGQLRIGSVGIQLSTFSISLHTLKVYCVQVYQIAHHIRADDGYGRGTGAINPLIFEELGRLFNKSNRVYAEKVLKKLTGIEDHLDALTLLTCLA